MNNLMFGEPNTNNVNEPNSHLIEGLDVDPVQAKRGEKPTITESKSEIINPSVLTGEPIFLNGGSNVPVKAPAIGSVTTQTAISQRKLEEPHFADGVDTYLKNLPRKAFNRSTTWGALWNMVAKPR